MWTCVITLRGSSHSRAHIRTDTHTHTQTRAVFLRPVVSRKSPGIRLLSIHKTNSDNMALHFSQRGISSPRVTLIGWGTWADCQGHLQAQFVCPSEAQMYTGLYCQRKMIGEIHFVCCQLKTACAVKWMINHLQAKASVMPKKLCSN